MFPRRRGFTKPILIPYDCGSPRICPTIQGIPLRMSPPHIYEFLDGHHTFVHHTLALCAICQACRILFVGANIVCAPKVYIQGFFTILRNPINKINPGAPNRAHRHVFCCCTTIKQSQKSCYSALSYRFINDIGTGQPRLRARIQMVFNHYPHWAPAFPDFPLNRTKHLSVYGAFLGLWQLGNFRPC